MSKWLKGLKDTFSKNQLVEIDRRPKIRARIRGYVVGVSDRFVLLQRVSDDMFLNGYEVLIVSNITKYRVLDDNDHFADRALKVRSQTPNHQPDINLKDFHTLFESIARTFPLITIHREIVDPSVCNIGKPHNMTEKTIVLDEIDASAAWYGQFRYHFKSITRISFGGCYESALWLVNCQESGDKKKIAKALKADKPYAKMSH